MKRLLAFLFIAAFGCCTAGTALAGNPERTGQAGATQLLVNPYGRSSGLNGANVATTEGIESVMNNVAGMAHNKGTEVVFTHTLWLMGTDIRINTFGFSQGFRRGGTIGLSVMAFDLGNIERTTIDNPDGGIGTFSPTFMNINLSYAKEMVEDLIYVGLNVKLIHESIPDAAANGLAFDAGVQFRTRNKKFRLGVSLRNIGPPMRYAGDGLKTRTTLGGTGSGFDNSVSIVAAKFELPAVLWVGAAYDIVLGGMDSLTGIANHRITPMFGFHSQSFGRDQLILGLEYAFKRYFAVRVSQAYEDQIFSEDESQNAYTGLAGGVSVNIPFGRGSKSAFGVDYSYRHTRWFNGTHTLGFRLTL